MAETTDLPQLTHVELAIMKELWNRGRLSAREMHEVLGPHFGWAYSTTRTTIERMVVKGLIDKQPFHGLHLYRPLVTRAQGVARLVLDFARDVLGTGPMPVVSLFADSGSLDEDDLAELRRLLKSDDREVTR